MNKIFGPVMQNAFVVDDLDAAMDHWINRIGIGPFFVFQHVKFKEAFFRGKPCEVDMTAAMAYWGDVQIELIKQHNDAPSIYSEFQQRGLAGMQHMGVITRDLDADLQRLAPSGIEPVQYGTVASGMRFAYVSSDFHPGGMIELIEANDSIMGFFDYMKSTAASWNGEEPIRRY
jgi:methylmalonyl-CoA/ethylmalonyl-CoA epimerase